MIDRAPMTHELKCWPEHFEDVLAGRKRVELRKDDREGGFREGDTLHLREWTPVGREYTGRTCDRTVTHVLRGEWVQAGYVALSLAEVAGSDLTLETTEAERAELARLAEVVFQKCLSQLQRHVAVMIGSLNGDVRAFLETVTNPAKIAALLADHEALAADNERLQRDVRCETPDPCNDCEDEWGDEAGAPTCHQSCERFDAYGKTATFRMKTAEIDGRCHFEAASQLEVKCQRLWERAEVAELAVRSMARETVDEDGLGDEGREDRFQYVLDCAYHDAIDKYEKKQARAALGLPAQADGHEGFG